MLSVGFYGKQLIVFALLVAAAGGGLWYVRSQAAIEASPRRTPLPTTTVASLQLQAEDGGTVSVNGELFTGLIRFEPDREIVSYQAFDEDGTFVEQLTTTVLLPRSVDPTAVIARHFASYGVVTPEPVVTTSGVTFTAMNLTPKASYRLEVVVPPGTIEPSLWIRAIDTMQNLPPSLWLAVAIGLPLLATLILVGLFAQARRGWQGMTVSEVREAPPADIAPATVGILVGGKASPRSLAATLLHLAQRGYLQVVHRADGFSFGKRRPFDGASAGSHVPSGQTQGRSSGLAPFENTLLEKIFTADSIKSTETDIQVRIGQHIYSRKIAEAYLAMYQSAVAAGWFIDNPERAYRRYRFLALAISTFAVLGFLLALTFGPEPKFHVLGWIGLFFVGVVMYEITPFLPRRTGAGEAAYREWLAFRNFLTLAAPVKKVADAQAYYERYLPYAVVMGVEVEWTERFLDLPFHVPDWYVSKEPIHVIEDFANSLFPIVGSVANDLAKAREPYAV
ncbi:DUF2207 domain-containing protein [Candidatus Berkelbacteria bacterium]|nr:DUF2207 domain-containing protein [Candidatus Berkelbacteria bacterium]